MAGLHQNIQKTRTSIYLLDKFMSGLQLEFQGMAA